MLTPEELEIYKAYYDVNPSYYINRLERYLRGDKYTFNYKGFFISFFYMSYRKMYKWILIFFAFIILESFIEGFLILSGVVPPDIGEAYGRFVNLIWGIVIGSMVNKLYIQDSIKAVAKINRTTDDHQKRLAFAKKKGGVTWVSPFIILVIVLVIYTSVY